MKVTDKVTITKPGKFQGLTGEVISNNELADKPLTIDLNPFGVWSFKISDCEPIGSVNKATQSTKTEKLDNLTPKEQKSLQQGIKEANAGDIEPIENLFKKRKYTPRGTKPKVVKGKRKYTRKKVD